MLCSYKLLAGLEHRRFDTPLAVMEQADYLDTQLNLLSNAEVHAVFVYVFSFPSMRIGEGPRDPDMMCFSLVKSFPDWDSRSKTMPPWAPKESFHRVADFFPSMLHTEI